MIPAHEWRRLRRVAEGEELDRLVAARLAGEPLQYLEGSAAFGPLELVVDSRVLIPRPETEQLWELAVSLVEHPRVIVDLCTGSGALALGMKHSFPGARVLATELSPEAVEVARLNSDRLGLAVEILEGDLFSPLPDDIRGEVDLVVSNPPYVGEDEWDSLPEDVRREPRMALVAGEEGLETIRRIVAETPDWLRPGGRLAVEIGETQGRGVSAMMGRFGGVEVRRDLAGRDRFVIGANGALV